MTFLPGSALCALCAPNVAREPAWAIEGGPTATVRVPTPIVMGAPVPLLSIPSSPATPKEDGVGPDPLERGSGSARIRLIDDATDESVISMIDLWRLDAPGNEHWTRGDRLQATGWSYDVFAHLPTGRYRVHAHDQRDPSDDPPAFVVRGLHVDITFRIPMPREFPVRLELYDEHGAPIRRAHLHLGPEEPSGEDPEDPAWCTKRRPHVGIDPGTRGGGWTCGCGGGLERLDAEATSRGFDLGVVVEPSRAGSAPAEHRVHVEGRGHAAVYVDFRAPGPHVYRAVLMPRHVIRAAFRMPDGTPAVDRGAVLEVENDAQWARPGVPFRLGDFSLKASVRLAGYRDAALVVRPGLPIVPVTLEARH